MTYFFDKSKVALEFLQHRGSKLKFINLERSYYFFFDFQPVSLPIKDLEEDLLLESRIQYFDQERLKT